MFTPEQLLSQIDNMLLDMKKIQSPTIIVDKDKNEIARFEVPDISPQLIELRKYVVSLNNGPLV